MKLSKTQSELLDALRAGVRVIYMRYMGRFNPNPYYFRNDTHSHCTAAAEALLKKGLVQIVAKTNFGDHEIKPA